MMKIMELIASKMVATKIFSEHGVTLIEAEEAFNNFIGYPLVDNRTKNRTKPATVWCLSETYDGRVLKLVFIPYAQEKLAILRTAYEPDDVETALWNENQ